MLFAAYIFLFQKGLYIYHINFEEFFICLYEIKKKHVHLQRNFN